MFNPQGGNIWSGTSYQFSSFNSRLTTLEQRVQRLEKLEDDRAKKREYYHKNKKSHENDMDCS